jgi:hypothetical protein
MDPLLQLILEESEENEGWIALSTFIYLSRQPDAKITRLNEPVLTGYTHKLTFPYYGNLYVIETCTFKPLKATTKKGRETSQKN